jgi:hypothetical protein
MATGDITLTKVGIFKDSTIAAGVTGANVAAQKQSDITSCLHFVYLGNGDILVLKEARAA